MPPVMTHVELQSQVVEVAKLLGWAHLHVRRSIGKGRQWATTTNVVGWPDLLLWNPRQPGRHLAIELKVPPDRLSADQEKVLDELAAAGFETHVVTPDFLRPQVGSPYSPIAYIFQKVQQ